MKRGNSNTKITDADRPSHVDAEDADAGDEEQGFSTAITHDVNTTVDVEGINTVSADHGGTRIIGLEQVQVSGDGDGDAVQHQFR